MPVQRPYCKKFSCALRRMLRVDAAAFAETGREGEQQCRTICEVPCLKAYLRVAKVAPKVK